jgi:hypothetical protein
MPRIERRSPGFLMPKQNPRVCCEQTEGMTDWIGADMAKRNYHYDATRATLVNELEQVRVPRITPDLLNALGHVVYAVQTKDGHVKIGFTTDLAHRASQVGYGHKAIIGFMRGEMADEMAVHRRLDGLAVKGREWYPWHPEVVAVVNEMRAEWGIEPITEPRAA